jgi:pimeloyl-ACP methyl ester carboxylesterase
VTLTPTRRLVDTASWSEPEGIRPRGTLFVITGRGEPPEIYERFGKRIAVDGYRVVVISTTDPFDFEVRAEIAQVVEDQGAVRPRVLAGSDVGARAALELAYELSVDAVIAAGLAVGSAPEPDGWEAEIAARTACPTHRSVLARSARGSLFAQAVAPIRLSGHHAPKLDVPVLALHGTADTISPLDRAVKHYRDIGVAEVVTVRGGLHDILNDLSHRSVAARIVLFLEQLRLEGDQTPILATTRLAGKG